MKRNVFLAVCMVVFDLLFSCRNPIDPSTPTYHVVYAGNGESSGSVPIDGASYHEGDSVTVLENNGNLVKTGFTFAGWNTESDGTGTTYTPASVFTMGAADVTLFALWTVLPTYTVTYDPNGATGGSVPLDTTNYLQGATVTVKSNSGSLSKAGFAFAGWNTESGGTGTTYTPASTFTMGAADVTLFALWAPLYDVTYNGNGATSGTVPIDAWGYRQGDAVPALGNTGNLALAGYSFAGWNTASDGSGTSYAVGAVFIMGAADVTLFAVWIPDNLTFTSTGTSISITGFVSAPTGHLVIPGGVTGIGAGAFSGCSGLTGVTIPTSVVSIGVNAFDACSGLVSIDIPSSVTVIAHALLANCTSLSSVVLPSTITFIDSLAFAYCPNITSISIPASVTSISGYAFIGCSGLTSITIPAGVGSIGTNTFEDCSSLASVTIPSSVTNIGDAAFKTCTSLTAVTIPPGVTSIGSEAFHSCSSLVNIAVQATTPSALGSNAFVACASELRIHVPLGTVALYFAATGWQDYASIIVSP